MFLEVFNIIYFLNYAIHSISFYTDWRSLCGFVVDLPTLTKKGKVDIVHWVVPNKIDMIALSSVHKESDIQMVQSVLGEHAMSILLIQGLFHLHKLAFLWVVLLFSHAISLLRAG
jgi:pyruvate kinase